MHSSRMRTVRSSGRLWGGGGCLLGGVCSGGVSSGGCLLWGMCLLLGGSAPRGCLLPGVSAPGCGVSAGGCLLLGGCLLWGGVCSWGGGVCGIPACTEADPPRVDRHTPVKT